MSGPNHIIGGIVFTGLYLSMWNENIYGNPAFLFFTAFFSVLPDVDHTKSLIGKMFYPLAKWLDRKFGHRTITHSLICYIGLAIIIGAIERIYTGQNIISKIFLWAYGSHLIFDMLTLQGVPLMYPFKRNPCVIPGNPKYRFRSSEFKSEAIFFVVFVCLAFSCRDLFANGFWNSYNSNFNTVKHVNSEAKMYDSTVKVQYSYSRQGKVYSGNAWLINSSAERLELFENGRFFEITNNDKSQVLKPIRSGKQFTKSELYFNDVSLDSFNSIIKNKPIQELKIIATLPLHYTKDNKPQSGLSVELSNVYNPVFTSHDIDSTDQNILKEIELSKIDASRENQIQQQFYNQKSKAFATLQANQSELQSQDLAIREKATKQQQQIKSYYESLQQPSNNTAAIIIRLQALQKRLRIKQTESISGYISWYLLPNK